MTRRKWNHECNDGDVSDTLKLGLACLPQSERADRTKMIPCYFWMMLVDRGCILKSPCSYLTHETCRMVMEHSFTKEELDDMTVGVEYKEAPSPYDMAKWAYVYLVELEAYHVSRVNCKVCCENGEGAHTCIAEKETITCYHRHHVQEGCKLVKVMELEKMVSLALIKLGLPTTHAISAAQGVRSLLNIEEILGILVDCSQYYIAFKYYFITHTQKY